MPTNPSRPTKPPVIEKKPPYRKLRGYAFDPSVSLQIDTVGINTLTYKVDWEKVAPGPIGEYIEVIDFDPSVKKYYTAVDLNETFILAQDGLNPSESDPQFHQQFVYAVAMTTIKNFEKALGRKVLWARRRLADNSKSDEYVQRLRIYPHALREANAYYSPQKKSLLFGYFSSTPADVVIQMPDSLVFTCLSHDIIAHETTHAILDGMHYYYNEPTNPDVLAFHEEFADIVALFQHFTFPEVLKHQIARTKGDLTSQNLLVELAQQFGTAIGNYGSLRNAIGELDPKTGEWKPKKPDPNDYRNVLEPHDRGCILVAAVFDAFLNIYKRRVADLLRIATNGTGILPQGELHPDLVNRLTTEASKAAGHVLSMCIRALDYVPPVDITYGDYLRAIVTADIDVVADDSRDYRLAFIDAFRRRGIYPEGIKTLSEESLQFMCEPSLQDSSREIVEIITTFLRDYREVIAYKTQREKIFKISQLFITGGKGLKELHPEAREDALEGLHKRIYYNFDDCAEFEKLTGVVFNSEWAKYGVGTSHAYKDNVAGPLFQVLNLRAVSRTGPTGKNINQIVFSIVQRTCVKVKDGEFAGSYTPKEDKKLPDDVFEFRGGCTMIFDLDSLKLRYCISKPLIVFDGDDPDSRKLDSKRIEKQYRYQYDEGLLSMSEYSRYFSPDLNNIWNEPFALLHTH